jgi:hypothetical protein
MSDNVNWLPCSTCRGSGTLPPRCELCEEPVPAEEMTFGLCPSCAEWIETEADKAEARRLQEQGRPWF